MNSKKLPESFYIVMGFCHHQRVDNRKVKHIIKSPYSTDQPERKVCACKYLSPATNFINNIQP